MKDDGDIQEYDRRSHLSNEQLHMKQDNTSIEKYTLKTSTSTQTQT